MATCTICFDEAERGVACEASHFTCAECLDDYIRSKAEMLAEVDNLAAKAESNGISPGQQKVLGGFIFCPCRGLGGCKSSEPLGDAAIAAAVSKATFEVYVESRTLLPLAQASSQAFAEANKALQDELAAGAVQQGSKLLAQQLARDMPDARQCAVCHYGPMDHRDCYDLAAHHGQVLPGGFRIDNSCPQCGFFSADKNDWPKWDGQLHEPAGGGALLDAAAARELVEADNAQKLREAQEKQERTEARLEEATRARRVMEAAARQTRTSLLSDVEGEAARRRKAEADAAHERRRREQVEAQLNAVGQVPRLLGATARGLPPSLRPSGALHLGGRVPHDARQILNLVR